MEEQAGSDAAGFRRLFEGWWCWYRHGEGGGGSRDEGGFWCHYIDFELRRGGGAAGARGVGDVHAKYAKAELRLGCPGRARAVLLSALDAFAADAEAREWLEREVAAYGGDSMRHGSHWRRLRGFLPFCSRRWPRPPAQGYNLLAAA